MATDSDGTEEKRIPLFDLKTPKRDVWRTLGLMFAVYMLAPCAFSLITNPLAGTYRDVGKNQGIILAIFFTGYAILVIWAIWIIAHLLARLKNRMQPIFLTGLLVSFCVLILIVVSWFLTIIMYGLRYMT